MKLELSYLLNWFAKSPKKTKSILALLRNVEANKITIKVFR